VNEPPSDLCSQAPHGLEHGFGQRAHEPVATGGKVI
jgi:hypothetical protein